MSDIRFNQWLHQSGTGGVSQSDGGHVGIGTTNPLIPVGAGNTHILNVGVVTCNNISAGSSITAGTFYGSGANLTGITQTTINNNAANRIITGEGGTTLNGEANLLFDGGTLALNGRYQRGSATVQDGDAIAGGININGLDMDASVIMSVFGNDGDFTRISGSKSRNASVGSHTIVQNNDVLLSLKGFGSDGTNFEEAAQIEMQVDGTPNNNVMPGRIVFKTATTDGVVERLRIASDGDVGIGTDSPQSGGLTVLRHAEARLQVWANGDGSNGKVALRADGTNTQMGTWSNHDIHLVRNATIQATVNSNGISFPAGKGIDFSATSDASGMTSELFDDYERGTHTYTVTGASSNPTVNISSNHNKLYYTKIGDMVHVTGELRWSFTSHGSGTLRISLPFTSSSTANSGCQGTAQTWNVNWAWRSETKDLMSEVQPNKNYMVFRMGGSNSLNEDLLTLGSTYQQSANSGYGVEYQVSLWYRTG